MLTATECLGLVIESNRLSNRETKLLHTIRISIPLSHQFPSDSCDNSARTSNIDTDSLILTKAKINVKMAAYLNARNAILLEAYDDDLIEEDEIAMLLEITPIPHRKYQRFNLEAISETESIEMFRFNKNVFLGFFLHDKY